MKETPQQYTLSDNPCAMRSTAKSAADSTDGKIQEKLYGYGGIAVLSIEYEPWKTFNEFRRSRDRVCRHRVAPSSRK
jgi:hypothetical protein